MKELYARIYAAVMEIPRGRVAAYGQVAARVGNKGLARVVGNALHVNPQPGIIPCHRVVNAKGELSGAFAFGSMDAQKRLLEEEGVPAPNFKVDLAVYGVKDDWVYAARGDAAKKNAAENFIRASKKGRIVRIEENPDKEIVKSVREGLKRRGGFCPCRREDIPENKCMCREFREQIADPEFEGFCHCMLYYKYKD